MMTQAAVNPQATPTQTTTTTAADILGTQPVTNEAIQATAVSPLSEKLSPKFQALLKRERSAVDRERAAKGREQEIEEKARKFSEREAKLEEFENLKKTNPLKALELLGLSYEELTSIALQDGKIPPELEVKRVEQKFDNYLREQQELEKRKLEDDKQAAENEERRITEQFKQEISTFIKENPDRYELISFEQNDELVYAVIDGHYERTKDSDTGIGEILTIAQAADKVEEHLEKKYHKARELKKLKVLLAPQPAVPNTADKSKPTERQAPKTLTNTLSATPTPPQTKGHILSDEERVRRAIAYAKGIRS